MSVIETTGNRLASYVCKACRKPINPQARICPHCRIQQSETIWHKISVALQWSAGAVTIVSLIVALNSLINFYASWLEKNNTVKELTLAARWLEQSDNFHYSWKLVEQAQRLDPGSALLRHYQVELAMRWLRSSSTRSNRSASYSDLADTVTPILYRALSSSHEQHAATIMAHVGFAQYLKSRDIVVLANIDELFTKAIQFDKNNIYANVYRGYWLLYAYKDQRYDEAIDHFEAALSNTISEDEKTWVNTWYLHGLILVRESEDPQRYYDIAKRIFALANTRRTSNRPIDSWQTREDILRLFGSYRETNPNIEQLLTVLAPEHLLQTLNWIIKTQGSKETMASQYVVARIHEILGNNETALPIYKELINSKPRKRLKQNIINAYVRITQQQPQETLKRTYMNDPIPESGGLWQFHVDSLLKFDFVWQPTNFTLALDYFQPREGNTVLSGRISDLMMVFTQARDRIKEWIDIRERALLGGDEYAFMRKNDERISKSNLYKVMLQYGELAYLNGNWNKSITAYKDINRRYTAEDPDLLYAMTRAYSQRAINHATTKMKKSDIKSALDALTTMVNLNIKMKKPSDWQQIKSDQALAVLRQTTAYKNLLRGR